MVADAVRRNRSPPPETARTRRRFSRPLFSAFKNSVPGGQGRADAEPNAPAPAWTDASRTVRGEPQEATASLKLEIGGVVGYRQTPSAK